MQELNKEQAEQVLVQLIHGSKLLKAEYDLLMQAIAVLKAPAKAE